MHYFVVRGEERFGPYTLSDLRRYRETGNLNSTDLVETEGAEGSVPLELLLAPSAAPPGTLRDAATPLPPRLPWWAVLILTIVTCGLFSPVWLLMIAIWVRRVDPMSKALWAAIVFLALRWGTELFAFVAVIMAENPESPAAGSGIEALTLALRLPAFVAYVIAAFSLKSSLENCLSKEMSYPIALGPFMTFFFAPIYFQYHLDELIRSKRGVG